MSSEDERTVWAGNLDDRVTEELLYELFLQAGPLEYVRHPKDKVSGRKKNFAFICYRHDCSVPYAISLMEEMKLCGRNMKVQSRHLQELRAQGLASYSHGGIHTLDPFQGENPSAPAATPQGCHQQAGLLGPQPNAGSLLGNIPGNIPAHVVALAQQQMALLNGNQSVPLSQNPSLNARMRPRDDRYGSINYSRNYNNSGEQSHQGYNQYQNNYRGRGPPRHVDNQTMRSMKSRSEDAVAQNSEMLANIQDRQGRFDKNRLGPRGNNYQDNNRYQQDREGHHRSNNRDYRQQPYDRNESHHSRNHDRHTSYDNHRRGDDRNSGSRNRSNSNDRYDRNYQNSQYGSRR